MFLVKGVKLQGIITWFDNFSVLLRRGRADAAYLQARHLHRHAGPFAGPARDREEFRGRAQGDACCRRSSWTAVRKSREPVTMFLVNGVMLQGEIAAFDLFCLLLRRDGQSQLVYKHAISTVQPAQSARTSPSG